MEMMNSYVAAGGLTALALVLVYVKSVLKHLAWNI